MNSYADAVAKAYLDQPPDQEVTQLVASKVRRRPCVYGVKSENSAVELTDRRVYRETWKRTSEYVLSRLGGTGGLMLGMEGREWVAVVRDVGRGVGRVGTWEGTSGDGDDGDGGGEGEGEEEEHATSGMTGEPTEGWVGRNARQGFTSGMRVREVCEHDACWRRRLEAEEVSGREGRATWSGQRMCIAGCGCLATNRHVIMGECRASKDRNGYVVRMRRKIGQLVNLIPRAPAVKDGLTKATPIREWCECRETVRRAEQAYLHVERGKGVRDEDWVAVERVLAGILPRCRGAAEMKERSRRELEQRVIRLIIEMQDIVVAMLQARRYDMAKEKGRAAHEDKIRWETVQAERAYWANLRGRLLTWAIGLNTERMGKAQAHMLEEAAKRRHAWEAEERVQKRSRIYLARTAKYGGEVRPVTLPTIFKQRNAKAQAKIRRLVRKNNHEIRLDTGKESVSRLQEAARWKRGRDIPGGGFEIMFDRGWSGETDWKIWLRVRPSGLLQRAGAPESATRWGLYAARRFRAGDSIGTVTGPAVRDLGTIGGAEARAALRELRAAGSGGHHVIQVNGRLIDGAEAASGVQYANSAAGVGGRSDNAAFKRTGTLAAEVAIEAGDEILVPWGEYWPAYRQQRESGGGAAGEQDAGASSSSADDGAASDASAEVEPEAQQAAAAVIDAYAAAEAEAAAESDRRAEDERRRVERRRSEEQQQRQQEERRKEQRWQQAKQEALKQRGRDRRRRDEDGMEQQRAGKRQRTDSSTGTAPAGTATAGTAGAAAGVAQASAGQLYGATDGTAGPQQNGEQQADEASDRRRTSAMKRRVPREWSSHAKIAYRRRTSGQATQADGVARCECQRCEVLPTDAPT